MSMTKVAEMEISTKSEPIRVENVMWFNGKNRKWITINFAEERKKQVIMKINKMLRGW